MAIPAATPALSERVEPNWVIEHTTSHAARAASESPGPSWPNSSRHRAGSRYDSIGTDPGRMSTPTIGSPASTAQATSSSMVAW